MRAGRVVWIALIIAAVVALGGGIWWYVAVPHTAEAQFALAEKMEANLRAESATRTVAELGPAIEATVEQYQRVGRRFGKVPPAAEALKRIARIWEEVARDPGKALAVLEQLAREYTQEDSLGHALRESARLIRRDADELKAAGKEEAAARYREALAKLEDFRSKFEKSSDAGGTLMEIGRIWQDGIEEPLIRPIEVFTKVLEDYPNSEHEPEAMYRLGRQYERIAEYERAVQIYAKLVEKYPKNKWAADATYARGKLLAEQMEQHDQAAEAFERLAQEFPDDPRAGSAAQEAQSQRNRAAAEEGEKYGRSRYGGNVPFDTSGDKALPPAQMLRQFSLQKLDAEKYDLDVTIEPADNRIRVSGTLRMVNRGEDRKSLLLMLGAGMEVSRLSMNGREATHERAGEVLKVNVPADSQGDDLWKKDAPGLLEFAMAGQYADVEAFKAMMGQAQGQGAPGRGGRGQPASAPAEGAEQPATATAPATAPGPKLTLNPQMALGTYGYGLSGAAWYPITIIGDVFEARVVLRAPGEAVTNGELVNRRPGAGAAAGTFEFQTRRPVFGLYFAYGPYVMQEKRVGSIQFYTYLKPANAAKHDAYVEVTNRILGFYGGKFAGFPYEKMAVIEAVLPPFLGGVGPASLMFLQEAMIALPDVPEALLAHELAHQWFGNLIPINMTDPGYSQWLSEGFATYCDALYTEHKDGRKAFDLHIQQYQQLYFQYAMSSPRGAPSIRDTLSPMSPAYRPVVYEKGALVLHMLRRVMGEDKFFELLRRFVEEYQDKLTTTDDFRRLAGTIHGEDLSWFFSQWYDRAVFAHWKTQVALTPLPGGTGMQADSVAVKVTVTQPDELVKMPVDVTLLGAGGERHVVKDVMLDKKENLVEVQVAFSPVKVIVDEENWTLKRLGTDHIWPPEKQAP